MTLKAGVRSQLLTGDAKRAKKDEWLRPSRVVSPFALLRFRLKVILCRKRNGENMESLVVSPKDLGMHLRRLRKNMGLTQAQLGNRVGLDQKKVSLIENGNQNSRLDTVFRLLSALEVGIRIQPKIKPAATDKDGW